MELKEEVSSLKSSISSIQCEIDNADAYERRDTVIVAGSCVPEVVRGENCSDLALNIFKEELRIELRNSDISTAHRLGPKPSNQTPDKRKLIVKFCRRDAKRQVILASKTLRSRRIFVNDSLTPTRKKIYDTLRSIKRSHPDLVKGVTTIEGRVFAFTKNSDLPNARDTKHLVSTMEALKTFCRDFVKQPLDIFLSQF